MEVAASPSLFLQGMTGSRMPIAVSHGEGHVEVRDAAHLAALESHGPVALRFVNNAGQVTETYPANPNGSPNGITAVTSASGRATVMMPHPERVFRTVSNSGTRKSGARTARGCACSATPVSNWAKYGLTVHRAQAIAPFLWPRFGDWRQCLHFATGAIFRVAKWRHLTF